MYAINMSRLLLVLFAILAIFSASTAGQEGSCPENETWKSCGTACPPSCQDPNPVCTLQCIAGCQCNPGLIRGDEGNCIPSTRC